MNCRVRRKKVCIFYMYVDQEPADNEVRISQKQISSIGGRLLTDAVSRLYHIDADELQRKTREYGKPYFPEHPEIRFNISHSGDIVMCAVSDYEIGVDVQIKKAGSIERVARRIMTPDEYGKFLADPDREEQFFRVWVMKEAYLKWTGEGLSRDLRGLPMEGWHRFLHVDRDYAACIWAERPLMVSLVCVRSTPLHGSETDRFLYRKV